MNSISRLSEPDEDDDLIIAEHKRKKPKRKPLPEDFPRQEVIHDLKPEEKICACGAELLYFWGEKYDFESRVKYLPKRCLRSMMFLWVNFDQGILYEHTYSRT